MVKTGLCLANRLFLMTAIAVVAMLWLVAIPAIADGEKILFSSPSGSTNSVSPASGILNKTPTDRVQDELFHPVKQDAESVNSMQGVFNVPTGAANHRVPSAKAIVKTRKDADDKKNWAFKNMSVLDDKSKDGTMGAEEEDSQDLDSSGKSPQSLIDDYVFGKANKTKATNATTIAQTRAIEWSSAVGKEGVENRGSFADQSFNPSGRSRISDDSVAAHSRADSFNAGRASVFDTDRGASGQSVSAMQGIDLAGLKRQRDNFQSLMDGNSGASRVGSGLGGNALNGFGNAAALGGNFNVPRSSGFSPEVGGGANPAGFHSFNSFQSPSSGTFSSPGFNTPTQNYLSPPASSTPSSGYTTSPFESIVRRPKL